MNLLQLCFSFSLCSFAACVIQVIVRDTEGYYWRDYKGEIPRDAVPGGQGKFGRTTYIGQGLHIEPVNGKLIPGQIDAAEKNMIYTWGGDNPYELTKNIKILCSQQPEKFEWIETDITRAKSMPPDNLVVGGYDTSYPLYIGRIHSEGEVVVGKVTLQEPYDAVGYAANGKAHFVKTTFEILSYNPAKVQESTCPVQKIINVNV